METRFEGYYARTLSYKIDYNEFIVINKQRWVRDDEILAYIRHCGERFCFSQKNNKESVYKLVLHENSMYNPLEEKDTDLIYINHWYHPYKMMFSSTEKEDVEQMYFADFCSLVREGKIIFKEVCYEEETH